MKANYILSLIAIIFTVAILGCSNSLNPITQPDSPGKISGYNSLPVAVSDMTPDGKVSGGMGVLGLFEMHINPSDLTGELTSLRKSSLEDVLEVVDVTNFMKLAPCADCAKIFSVSLDADNHIVVNIGIKHPFAAGDPLKPVSGRNRGDLHVFNVEGVVISNAAGTSFSGLGQASAGFSLLNADGCSGYLDDAIDEIFPTDASIHPYIMHFDDYSQGNFDASNPMGFESVTTPPPTGNLVMAMGSDYDRKDYILDIPDDESVDFIFAVECTYAVSAATKIQRFTPEYRIPQHNKKAASEVGVEIVSNELGGGNTSSTATLQISVVDISHGVTVGTALNEMRADSSVSAISVEIPGITSGSVSFSTTPLSGTGHDPSDPLIYEGTVTNSLGGLMGTYTGLVKVTDSYNPGLNTSPLLNGMDGIKRVDPIVNPLAGLFTLNEFATYQLFSIDVGTGEMITIISPNGGESWSVGSGHEITWNPAGYPGTVFIEYSKDNFVSDIHSIATGEANDGSYMWASIPDDPSTTVRVRVSLTSNPNIQGTSEEDFSIVTWHIEFSPEGVIPEQHPGNNDISPAVCVETDGDIKMAYNDNNPATYGASAFSWACKSSDGLTWSNFYCTTSSWGGMWACHGDETKILANTTGNSWRTIHLWSQTTFEWATPFNSNTEAPYDGAVISTYITRQPELLQDANGYVYVFGDRYNVLQFKKSEVSGSMSGGPSGSIWQYFPVYNIGTGYFSRARSAELAPNNTMYFVYYVNDTANVIKMAHNTSYDGLTWDVSPVVYDGASTGTTGAHDPGMDIDPDGDFHVTFVRVNGSNNELCYVNSTDGTSWSSPVVIDSLPDTINDNPICFFEFSSTEFLATVYRGGDHIYITFSDDYGQKWATPVQVDSLLPENDMPDFCVSSDGVMHIAWSAMNGTNWDVHYRNAWLEQ